MAVTYYRSDDPSAPVLNMQLHSYINVLKACLVNGYGAKPAAGWSVAVEDAPNGKAIFRNAVAGSGTYYQVRNNGQIKSSQTVGQFPYACTIKGAASFSDVNTTTGDFPRAVVGSDLHFTTDYGVFQSFSAVTTDIFNVSTPVITNTSTTLPWAIIADEKTAYLFTFPFNSGAGNHDYAVCQVTMIGDTNIIGSNTSLPKAAIIGGRNTSFPHLGGFLAPDPDVYLEHSLGAGNANSVKGVLYAHTPKLAAPQALANLESGSYLPYPHPTYGGVSMSAVLIAEYAGDPKRTGIQLAVGASKYLTFASLRGCYGNHHAVVGTKKVCAPGDLIQVNSRTYLATLVPGDQSDQASQYSMLYDITGAW